MGRAPLLGAACPRTPSTEQNSILQLVLQALRPAPQPGQDSILELGFMGRCTPPNPRGSFLTKERNQSSPGRPRSPLSMRHKGNAWKIFLRGFHTSSERFFRCADALATLLKAHFSRWPSKEQGGEGGRSPNYFSKQVAFCRVGFLMGAQSTSWLFGLFL